MNRQQKIKEAQILEKQINDLKTFSGLLECTITLPSWQRPLTFVKKKTTFSFLGMWTGQNTVELQIPEFMQVEINVKCRQWIEELERRADELVGV